MRNTPTTTPTVAPTITPRLFELSPVDAAALEVEVGVDADPVVSAAVLPVGVAVLGATTLSPLTGQPKTVNVVPSGTTDDVSVHDHVLPSVSDIRNWSSHVSDCWAVTVDVHCEGNVALLKSGTLSL